MTKFIFTVFTWLFILLNCYQAYSYIGKITDNNLKNFANVVFFLIISVILSITFLAEYLKNK